MFRVTLRRGYSDASHVCIRMIFIVRSSLIMYCTRRPAPGILISLLRVMAHVIGSPDAAHINNWNITKRSPSEIEIRPPIVVITGTPRRPPSDDARQPVSVKRGTSQDEDYEQVDRSRIPLAPAIATLCRRSWSQHSLTMSPRQTAAVLDWPHRTRCR